MGLGLNPEGQHYQLVIKQLAEGSKMLNYASEQAVAVIQRVEKDLAEAGVGFPLVSETPYFKDHFQDPAKGFVERHYHLGYLKMDGGWHLIAEIRHKLGEAEPVAVGRQTLLSAGRAVRMEAEDHIMPFLKDLLKEQQRLTATA